MTKTEMTRSSGAQAALIVLAALLVPGLGQFIAGRRGRGLGVLLSALLSAWLISWSLDHQNIGKVTLGGTVTSWLWLPFSLYWVWNVLDARAAARRIDFNILPGVACVAIVLYGIAWNLTDVRLNRLVERFGDARTVVSNLFNPDVVTISVAGQDQICAWQCLFTYADDKLTGQPVQGGVRWSDNLSDILGSAKRVAAPSWLKVPGLVGPDGRVPVFAGGTLLQTIAMGLMATLFSTLLAVPVSFLAAQNIMARLHGGLFIYYGMRTILNVVRAVDTIVWGLIVIVWVGLGSFAGVIALTIHSVAALGKLFSEEIEHIDPGPVEAVTATGANLLQTIRYAVVPQITPSFLAYALLRWDINMRSATVIGFVAGGGIGFFVVETVRQGGYQQYATALWAVVLVIMLVDYISGKWRQAILRDQPPKAADPQASARKRVGLAFYAVLAALVFIYCWNLSGISLKDLFSPGANFGQLIVDFVSIDLSPAVFQPVIQQMLVTVFQAMLATTIGALLALPFSFLAARNLTGRSRLSVWLYYLTRSLFNVLRSIEALLYVVIFIFWVGIGPFAGTLALAVTSFALIGKLFADAIENIDSGPLEAVTATGADRVQMIAYAVLPQLVPPFVSYLIYQWDINIRMATIIGFAGGGGIGLTLTTFFGSLQYHKAGTVVACIVVVVALMDYASAKLRHSLL
jgi:phosphonate ABC transporter permease subunit PhnE